MLLQVLLMMMMWNNDDWYVGGVMHLWVDEWMMKKWGLISFVVGGTLQ